jgi:hypothetical protein
MSRDLLCPDLAAVDTFFACPTSEILLASPRAPFSGAPGMLAAVAVGVTAVVDGSCSGVRVAAIGAFAPTGVEVECILPAATAAVTVVGGG